MINLPQIFCLIGTIFLLWTVELKAQRDPYKWPFASNSIWNMPIHNNAVYANINLPAPTGYGVTVDEDIIILKPNAPITAVNTNTADWTNGADRCPAIGANLMNVPIPGNFIYSSTNWLGSTPNAGIGVLMPDGVTIKNSQPFARCTANSPAASHYNYPDNNITTDGIDGAHGGSGMSIIGGSIRLGELLPGSVIKHALKMNIDKNYLFYDATTQGYRWPARKADGYAPTGYTGSNIVLRMGSLLALDKNLDINSIGLTTEPAKIIARTLQNYGAYIVDDPFWDVIAFGVEHSPDGRVITEFQNQYGYGMESAIGTAWSNDIAAIVTRLKVVDNNSQTNLGGGPTTDLTNRRAPIACNIGTAGSGLSCPVTNVAVTGITVNPSSSSVNTNGTRQLSVSLTPTNATNTNVTWTTSNATIATVNSSGLVTGLSAGSCTITAKSQDGNFTSNSAITVTNTVAGNFKIMPLGDSKVEGGGTSGHQSWRGYLRAKLIANGNTIDYVGPRSNSASGDGTPADNDHAGFGGYSIGPDTQTFCTGCETTGVFENIQNYFVAQNPDIVLLSVGVNDFFNAPNHPANYSTTAPQRYQNLVNKILQLKPLVTLVLGTIEPVKWDIAWGGDPNDNYIGALNAKIKQIADASTTDKIFFADIRNQFLPTWSANDYFDDIHLSQQGAEKAATIWYNALLPILNVNSIAVTGISVNPTSSSVSIGGTTQLAGTVVPSNATNKTVSWTSSNTSVATVNATGLVTGVATGSSTITLTTQDGNKTATCAITVTASNSGTLIPAKIQAENYTSMNGIQTETTTDAGGGLNIGYVDNNDWVDYLINVPTTGTYTIDLRIAATTASSQLQIKSGATVLATVNVPNTGGWQNFQTVSTNISLSAGTQTIRLFCTVQNWNLNWLEFKNGTTIPNTTNLLSTNPSFESQTGASYSNGTFNGITGWALNNTAYNSIAVTSGNAQNGNNKLELVFAGRASTLPANYATVTAGQPYTLSMAISKVANTNTAIQSPLFFRIDWFNSSNVLISSTSSGNVLDGATSAWAVFSVTGTAPTNATKAGCFVELVNPSFPNNDVARFNIDNIKLNAGSTAARVATQSEGNEDPAVSLNVYPMPASADFTVELKGFNSPELMIVDVLGKIVFTKKSIVESKFQVSNTFNKGVYILNVQDQLNKKSTKIIIE